MRTAFWPTSYRETRTPVVVTPRTARVALTASARTVMDTSHVWQEDKRPAQERDGLLQGSAYLIPTHSNSIDTAIIAEYYGLLSMQWRLATFAPLLILVWILSLIRDVLRAGEYGVRRYIPPYTIGSSMVDAPFLLLQASPSAAGMHTSRVQRCTTQYWSSSANEAARDVVPG